jgi:biuret amidohydrolase
MTVTRAFPSLRRDNTALIIIDMQRDFLDEGAPVLIPGGRNVVPALQRLLHEFREMRLPVIHAFTVWRKDGVDVSPFTTSEELKVRGLREGEPGTEIIPELAPTENEYKIVKKKYSAFYLTDLELLLRALGVTYLVVGGVATNYCIRSTVHDACFREFMAVVPAECTTSYTKEEHEQSLRDIANGFGQVMSLDKLLAVLKG